MKKIQHIESSPPLFSRALIAGAVGAASGAFARLWRRALGDPLATREIDALNHHFNQYGVAAVSAFVAFQAIAWFDRGQMLDALHATASCGFIPGAIAMGVASLQFFDRRPA